MNNLKTALGRRNLRNPLTGPRTDKSRIPRSSYYDPFFADPETVEDDYRRLKRDHG